MGKFTHLMIHCSATPPGREVTRNDIEKWHLIERGWSRVGYSALFGLDGDLDIMIPFDRDDVIESWEISNGARGWNGRTRHICYAGGWKGIDTRTIGQFTAMRTFCKMHAMLWPEVKIIGHNQVSYKQCPSFNVPEWCKMIGIPSKSIDFKTYI